MDVVLWVLFVCLFVCGAMEVVQSWVQFKFISLLSQHLETHICNVEQTEAGRALACLPAVPWSCCSIRHVEDTAPVPRLLEQHEGMRCWLLPIPPQASERWPGSITAVLGWFTGWAFYLLVHSPNWSFMPWISRLLGWPSGWCSVPGHFPTRTAWDRIFNGFNLGKLWCRAAEPGTNERSHVPRMLLSESLNISRGTSWHKEAVM